MLIHFGLGMVCCSPYLALVTVQHDVVVAVEELPTWVQVEAGAVFSVSIGTAVCAILFAALSVVLAGWSRVHWGREASMNRRSTYALSGVTRTVASEATA